MVCFRNAEGETSVTEPSTELVEVYDAETRTLRVTAVIPPSSSLTIQLTNPALVPDDRTLTTCQKLVTAFRMDTWAKQTLYNQLPALITDPAQLVQYELKLTESQLRALAEVLTGAGYHRSSTRRSQDEAIILWNNQEKQDVGYRLAALGINGRSEHKQAPLPPFGIFTIGEKTMSFHEGLQPSVGKVTVAAWFDGLVDQIRHSPANREGMVVQFDISGENGRTAYLMREDDEIQLIDGTHPNADVTISAAATDWLALLNGETTPEALFLAGKIAVAGNLEIVLQMADSISLSPPSTYRADIWRLRIEYFEALSVILKN